MNIEIENHKSMLDNPGKSDPISIYALEKKKKLNLAKIDKMFKELQVVTLFGDMQITLSSYIEKMSDFKNHQDRWTCTQKTDQSLQDLPQYDLTYQLKRIKEEHVKYISTLALTANSSGWFHFRCFSIALSIEELDDLSDDLMT